MRKNNQKGFTLILSLVLLLVMSLMGGALIVISSGDHQSNNTSDQYQQTFYVAEHALIEAEKRIINRMIGPWTEISSISSAPVGSTPTEITAHNNYIDQLRATAIDGLARNTDGRDIPINTVTPTETPWSFCWGNSIYGNISSISISCKAINCCSSQLVNIIIMSSNLRRSRTNWC